MLAIVMWCDQIKFCKKKQNKYIIIAQTEFDWLTCVVILNVLNANQ